MIKEYYRMRFSLLSSLTLAFIALSIIVILSVLNTSTVEYSTDIGIDNPIPHQTSIKTKAIGSDNKNIKILELKTFRFSSVDGSIKVDSNNSLVIDRDLRHWFDFYLSAIGELTLDQIILMMQQEINQLPSPGREQAHELLSQYLSYKQELSEYDNRELLVVDQHSNIEQLSDLEQLSQRLDWQMRLRRRYLSPNVVESFWQHDEVIDLYALNKLMIKNSDLSLADKQVQLETLEQSLPDSLQTFKQDLYIANNLAKKEKTLAQIEDPEALRELRIQEVGIEATDRLESIDKTQAAWQARILAYQQEILSLSEAEGISTIDREGLIAEYRQQNFSDKEQLRLNAAVVLLSEGL